MGGNAKTTIVICASPASLNEAETKDTLDFGKRAKTIKNMVGVNKKFTTEDWKKRYEKEKAKVTVSMTTNKNLEEMLQKWMERMYQMLNEKDDDIHKKSGLIEKLKYQMLEQEELIYTSRKDNENLTQEMNKMQSKNESAKKDVKEMLTVLRELTVNYNKKSQRAMTKFQEYTTVSEKLLQQQSKLNFAQSELDSIKEFQANLRMKTSEMIRSLLTFLGEVKRVIEMAIALEEQMSVVASVEQTSAVASEEQLQETNAKEAIEEQLGHDWFLV